MIREENIERLSERHRNVILDNDGKLGLYSKFGKDRWLERGFITTRKALNKNGSMVIQWNHYAEWQAPPKVEDVVSLIRNQLQSGNVHSVILNNIEKIIDTSSKPEKSCNQCEHNNTTYLRHPCKSCDNLSMYVKAKAKTKPKYAIPTNPRPPTKQEIAQFCATNGYVLCYLQKGGEVIFNANEG